MFVPGYTCRTPRLSAFALLFVLLGLATLAAPLSATEDRVLIRLQQAEFDPLADFSRLPPEWVFERAPRSGENYYLVQFDGPVLPEWRARLAAEGAVILDYVPDFAYIVRFDDSARGSIEALPAVRWVGLYPPVFRISNDLLAVAGKARAGALREVVVRGFPGEPALRPRLAAVGGVLLEYSADSGGGAIYRAAVPETALLDLAREPGLAWMELDHERILLNEIARSDTAMDKNQVETASGLYGAGQIVAVGDTGVSTGNADTVHQDFAGRVFGGNTGPGSNCGGWADNHGHGTHVAGSVLGSGFHSGADIANQDYAGSNAGIAPEALLYAWSFCNDFSGLPNAPYNDYYGVIRDADDAARINTNSWGYTGGFGQYNTFTRETDRFVWDFPDMVLLYAAGNSGRDSNADGVVNPGSMSMPATAKNVITVGASENLRMSGGYNPGGPCSTWGGCWPSDFPANPVNSDRLSDDPGGMVAFSGRGPTSSGRLKPDVVAPGSNIVSTRNENAGTGWGVYDSHYIYNGGTSMATPLVAGASAVVREFYDLNYGVEPGAALVKATLINGAFDMTPGQYGAGSTQDVTARPDVNQGWGRVDLPNTLIYDGARGLWFEQHAGLDTGDSETFSLYIDAAAPLRVTLVWPDYPGTEASHGALVNDLDLIVEGPDGVYRGNYMMNGNVPDRVNNVEGVDLDVPVPGLYTITVEGFNVPQGAQPFALVVSGDLGGITVDPASAEVCAAGGSIDYALTLSEGFSATTALTADGLPAGAVGTFDPNPVVFPVLESIFTVDSLEAAGGEYLLDITATDTGDATLTSTVGVTLTVYAAANGPIPLQSPGDGMTDVDLQPAFAWDPAAAAAYRLQVATDPGFTAVVIDTFVAGTGFIPEDPLDTGTDYYWRVRAPNSCGDGDWSAAFQFQTRFVPTAQIAPDTFAFTVAEGGSDSDSLLIANIGTGSLLWSIETDQTIAAPVAFAHDPALDEAIELPEFTVVALPNGGSPVVFEPDAGILTRGDVVGFSFSGTATGVSGDSTWASDTCMLVRAPDGTTYGVGGLSFPNTDTPGCGDENSWDFQGGGSTSDGTYASTHDDVFAPPVGDTGEWTITFIHDWNNDTAADITWSDVTVTLHKQPLPVCDDELADVDWLSVDPSAGGTVQGETDAVAVMVNAAGVPVGEHQGYLCLTTNDAQASLIPVPVALTVTEGAADAGELTTDSAALDFGEREVGDAGSLTFTVANTAAPGAAALALETVGIEGAAFAITGGSCEAGVSALVSGMHCTVEVSFAPTAAGNFAGEIVVEAADGQSAIVSLSGAGRAREDGIFTDRFESDHNANAPL